MFFHPDTGALTKTVEEDGEATFSGTFSGLSLHHGEAEDGAPLQAVYQLHVEEDPVRAAAEMKRQREARPDPNTCFVFPIMGRCGLAGICRPASGFGSGCEPPRPDDAAGALYPLPPPGCG